MIVFRPGRLYWLVKDEKIRRINELAAIMKNDRYDLETYN